MQPSTSHRFGGGCSNLAPISSSSFWYRRRFSRLRWAIAGRRPDMLCQACVGESHNLNLEWPNCVYVCVWPASKCKLVQASSCKRVCTSTRMPPHTLERSKAVILSGSRLMWATKGSSASLISATLSGKNNLQLALNWHSSMATRRIKTTTTSTPVARAPFVASFRRTHC